MRSDELSWGEFVERYGVDPKTGAMKKSPQTPPKPKQKTGVEPLLTPAEDAWLRKVIREAAHRSRER